MQFALRTSMDVLAKRQGAGVPAQKALVAVIIISRDLPAGPV